MEDEKKGAQEGAEPAEPVIESASATTSPENARSGNGAYVIFAVVAVLLIALVSALSSCAGILSDAAWRSVGARSWGYGGGQQQYWDQDDTWLDLLDELELYGQDTYYLLSSAGSAR